MWFDLIFFVGFFTVAFCAGVLYEKGENLKKTEC